LNATFNGDVRQIEQGIQMKVHRPQPSKRALLYYCHKEPRRADLKGLGTVIHRAFAVFTSPIGSLNNLLLLGNSNVTLRHERREDEYQVDASTRAEALGATGQVQSGVEGDRHLLAQRH